MVVASRALHAEAEEDIRRGVGDVVQDSSTGRRRRGCCIRRSSGGENAVASGLRVSGTEFIAGELLLHKAVVRLVRVERANDIIAIAPRIRPIIVRT